MSDENNEECEIVEEIINKSVSCTNIPEAFLDKNIAKRHFAQFGRIHSFTLSPKRRTCTVEYETEDAAEVALIDGGFYEGEVFDIFFTPKVVPAPRPMIDYIDPDVQDELSAMSPRGAPYLRPVEAVEVPITKSMSPTRILEPKRTSRLKAINDQFGFKPVAKPAALRPVDQIAKNELEALMRKPAFTSEEKYRVLDARDKLIRLTTSKSTDIKTAAITQGVCPDMCPEKERLMREATHRVSSYELEENSKNVMKHSLALKQYARSSADQESALPHELRPEPILKMTMNYLLHNIVDLCDSSEGNVGDWFHFVWDRTRSIRKDILQQELCSQTAVSLIEQCARFHIHCAARLVAEEAQIFDQKINSENLTKCLQSLKYLYHDLNLRREQCVNEAEFRAYVVLLNLNDCQFFWEVKQFPHHILHSKEIRFAMACYLAMANNNYVKFFQLVRQTTYMNACILLRYFNQVRVNALNTMIKAYVPKHSATMSISYWQYILAFEDSEQTAQFFEYYGMQCDRIDDRVFLDRNSFYYPNLPFILDRAINVVEHKRTCSVGEAIYGGPLEKCDDFLKYVPHDSFDESGLLSTDAWTAEDQNYLNPPTPKRKSAHTPFREEDAVFKIPMAPSPKLSPNPKPSIFTKLSPKIESKGLRENGTTVQPALSNNLFGKSAFSDVTPLNNIFQTSNNTQSTLPSKNVFGTPSVSQNIFGSAKSSNLFQSANSNTRFFAESSTPSSSIFSSFVSAPTTNNTLPNDKVHSNSGRMENNEDDEMKQLERQKEKIEMEIRKEEEAELLRQEAKEKLQRQKEMEEKAELERKEKERIEKEKQKADALKRLQRIEQISEEMADEMISDFVCQELDAVATKILQIYHEIETATEDIYYELLTEIIFEECAEWKRKHQEKIDKIESTPIWLPDKSLFESVPDLMHPLQDETLNMSKRYRHGMPTSLSSPVIHENMIDIFEIVQQHLSVKGTTIERIRKRPTFWKCGISIPNCTEDKSYQRIEKWLDKLFIRREPNNSKLFFCEQQFVQSSHQYVAISLRKFRGIEMSNEEGIVDANDANGLNAMVFIMTASNLKETKKRLLKVIQCKSIDCAIGIVMLNVDANHEQYLRFELGIDELTTNSGCLMKHFYAKEGAPPSAPSTRNKLLIKCFKWIATNFKFNSFLEMQTTTSFFDQCLGNQFWHRIIQCSTHNPGLFKAATNIGFIIDTYNIALEHLDSLIAEDLSIHPLFPEEFKRYVKIVSSDIPVEYQCFPNDWKDPNRSKQLRQFLTSLRLQPVLLKTASLEEIQEQLLVYAHRHITDKLRSDRAAYRMIKVLLEYLASNSEQNFQQQISSFNWIDSVRLLTLEILLFQYDENGHSLPTEVIYNRDKFKQYLNEPWWLHDNSPMTRVRLSFDREDGDNDDVPKSKKPRPNPVDKDEIEQMIARGAEILEKADAKIDKFKTTVNAGREITHELDSMLYEHERNLRVQNRWAKLEIND